MATGAAFYWQETVFCCAIDFIGAVVKMYAVNPMMTDSF